METVKFGSVIKEMRKSKPLSKEEIDEQTSFIETPYKYIKLSSIDNTIINKNVTYLKSIQESFKCNVAKKGDVIIALIGFPLKMVVVEEDNSIVVYGRVFEIIKLDEEKIDPYYLCCLFSSKKERIKLSQCYQGSNIVSLNLSLLKNMDIPLPSLEEQRKIATEYKETVEQLKRSQNQTDTLIKKLCEIV